MNKWSMFSEKLVFKEIFGLHDINPFCDWRKPGGLDSRDQSRSRTSIVSRQTFENGRDYP
jgi:hypothetical protein